MRRPPRSSHLRPPRKQSDSRSPRPRRGHRPQRSGCEGSLTRSTQSSRQCSPRPPPSHKLLLLWRLWSRARWASLRPCDSEGPSPPPASRRQPVPPQLRPAPCNRVWVAAPLPARLGDLRMWPAPRRHRRRLPVYAALGSRKRWLQGPPPTRPCPCWQAAHRRAVARQLGGRRPRSDHMATARARTRAARPRLPVRGQALSADAPLRHRQLRPRLVRAQRRGHRRQCLCR